MFPVQGGSAVTPEYCLLSMVGEMLGQGRGGAEGLSCCASSTRVLHSGSQVCSWAKQLSFNEQQMVCCRADGIES